MTRTKGDWHFQSRPGASDTAPDAVPGAKSERRVYAAVARFHLWLPAEAGVPRAVSGCARHARRPKREIDMPRRGF